MLDNQVSIITGGGGGLGRAIAELLHKNNSHVIVLEKNSSALEALPEEYEKYCLDITDHNIVVDCINKIVTKHKKIDILINNAGLIYNSPLVNILDRNKPIHDYESYRKVIDINLNAVFLMGSIVAEKMIRTRTRGVIVNISSVCSDGNAGQSAYSAAKAGVNALTKTWAKELGAFGIRSLSISPGFIETESTLTSLDQSILNALKKRIPLRQLGQAHSVAELVVSSILNEYINGAILSIDGGYTL